MRGYAKLICLAGAAVMAATVALGAQAKDDPIVGMWMLDTGKSTFKPGPPPKSVMLSVDAAGKGYKISVDAVGADGKPMRWGFSTDADGKDAPVTGNPNYDTAALTRLSAGSGTTVYKKGGKPVMTVKSSVSADGKTLTTTATGTNPAGQEVHNVSVYMKH
jgi:hypothetical protein